MAEVIEIGDVSVTRVAEWEGEFSTAHELLPDSRREVWDGDSAMLVPDHWNPDNDALVATLQSYLVRSGGKNILIDTGAGDDKDRPYLPMFHMLKSGFLDRLAAAGVTPEQIDLVVLTHIHVDHVGWNTSLVDGEWVPTFPNADYVFPRVDFDYWDTSRTHERRGAAVNLNMFDDSVAPIARHGKVTFWEGSHVVDDNITLEVAPGHTPGHALIKVESRGDRAAFVGDLLHSPGQILQPDWSSVFSEDPVQGAATRRKVLGWAADENILIMPAHFGGDHAVEIDRRGDGFAVKGWRAFKDV